MHVISKKKLQDFWKNHADSRVSLNVWYKIIDKTNYRNLNELRKTFPTADKVGNKIVFNIKGNTYRLITSIHFNRAKVYVRTIMTHDEYNKGEWKND